MDISLKSRGSFSNTKKFLANAKSQDYLKILHIYGKKGVNALAAATPEDEGLTATCWEYEVRVRKNTASISWYNTNLTDQGTPIVILLQYGHGTGTGGYVEGYDYINPAIKPIFDDISETVWKVVKAL